VLIVIAVGINFGEAGVDCEGNRLSVGVW
jgi:hypothetical protein